MSTTNTNQPYNITQAREEWQQFCASTRIDTVRLADHYSIEPVFVLRVIDDLLHTHTHSYTTSLSLDTITNGDIADAVQEALCRPGDDDNDTDTGQHDPACICDECCRFGYNNDES